MPSNVLMSMLSLSLSLLGFILTLGGTNNAFNNPSRNIDSCMTLKCMPCLFHDSTSISLSSRKPYDACKRSASFLLSCSSESVIESENIETSRIPTMDTSSSNKPCTKTTTTRTGTTATRTSNSIHLLSLPSLSDDSTKLIKDIWKWKDVVLGDGRDYFIPRPRALKAFSDILVGSSFVQSTPTQYEYSKDESIQSSSKALKSMKLTLTHTIQECAVLSNCARMDVLICLSTKCSWNDNDDTMNTVPSSSSSSEIKKLIQESSQILVTNCVLEQLTMYKSRREERGRTSATILEGISSFLDLPGMIVSSSNNEIDNENDYKQKQTKQYRNEIVSQSVESSTSSPIDKAGTRDSPLNNKRNKNNHMMLFKEIHDLNHIIAHFCSVAAGIAPRDSRPNREVTFRPFSSRDAHIMLQLKRTNEVASSSQYTKMKMIFDTALNAGKTARDVTKVPILEQMKKYDCEGKYSVKAPPELEKKAVEDVQLIAIGPAVVRCVDRLLALENSEHIFYFQKLIEDLMDRNEVDRKILNSNEIIKKKIHETIMKLRKSDHVNLEDILYNIEVELQSQPNARSKIESI
mmetsp:Transcript_14815/g.18064  ORF Transcript_14815/g.18064 Transcript_14815/m.18064 type:complete len:576 (+) Transcript_14815:46-1773(+)